jgi:hypothetical protein
MKLRITRALIAFSPLFLAGPALAKTVLSGDEIAKLIAGNTVEVTIRGGAKTTGKLFWGADGICTSELSGRQKGKGKWRISSDGLHCHQWGNKDETCAQIVKEADGTYSRVKDGQVKQTWHRVTPGNAIQ